ncbi:hypothetical protein GH741_03030 [Aquibacillus halophilus]|uniref:DUF4340 domain-containing protein n=1 Tax=Aquibacillus halophilus TaxID=930132 RepID=A0A6A8D7B8_9BACI|nr:hypothetical protein [Aquibacillus halophilus]MRH41645.1 hypothetical protein [Aquibacillus halophilus]
MNKWIIVGLLLLVTLGTGWYYISQNYFFNPITFEKDNVTYLDWSFYQNPLQIDYMVRNENHKWETTSIREKEEIHYVFNKLKEANPLFNKDLEFDQNETKIKILIRHMKSESKGSVLLGAEGTTEILFLHPTNPENPGAVEITGQLKELINKRISQGTLD